MKPSLRAYGQRRAATVRAAIPAIGTAPGQWLELVSAQAPEPTQWVLSTDVSDALDPARPVRLRVSPANWQNASPYQGAIRLRYGSEGSMRERIIDIAAGTFAVPPATDVQVAFRVYNQSALLLINAGFLISAGLAPGAYGGASGLATSSGARTVAAGAVGPMTVVPVPGALYCRFAGFDAGDDVQLTVDDGSPFLSIDYAGPTYVPGVPDVAIAGQSLVLNKAGADSGNLIFEQLVQL